MLKHGACVGGYSEYHSLSSSEEGAFFESRYGKNSDTSIEPRLNMICNAFTRPDDCWVVVFIFWPEEVIVVMRLFVGNLSWDATPADLEALFGEVGTVASANIITDRESGRSRGFGFIEMENDEEARTAIERFHDYEFMGRPLTVNEARPRERRERRW